VRDLAGHAGKLHGCRNATLLHQEEASLWVSVILTMCHSKWLSFWVLFCWLVKSFWESVILSKCHSE
jgi:hypothetical protein